ncbi:MAG TPA: dicarboxylate/amino acid:cation symporter [Polyangiaceae bacterium]|nr:dicarboxylate/amino acid:cation symporter [Polyangiaceae bacterium]
MSSPPPAPPEPQPQTGVLARWARLPLYSRIVVGLLLGLAVGYFLGPTAHAFDWPARLILRMLGAIAPVLILVAVVRALITAEIHGKLAVRMAFLLLLNTLTAILIGLFVANVLRPGQGQAPPEHQAVPKIKADIVAQLLDNVPDSLVKPFVENRVIAVVLIAVALGIAARGLPREERRLAEQLASLGFDVILRILSWVLALVPLAVFGKVASIVGVSGFAAFHRLGWFVLAVLVALALQTLYYLTRIRFGSWVRPIPLLRSMRDALVMAFSTASSTATMPVTYQRLRYQVGLRERSASLGALVGSNFNNDGTALYEAMSALFVAQMLQVPLSLTQQVMVVLTSVVASVGAAGIPEAGLVTMTLVFSAVHLPLDFIALLLTVDWFLDRCRTMINVLGDVNVACLLDGRQRETEAAIEAETGAEVAPASAQ